MPCCGSVTATPTVQNAVTKQHPPEVPGMSVIVMRPSSVAAASGSSVEAASATGSTVAVPPDLHWTQRFSVVSKLGCVGRGWNRDWSQRGAAFRQCLSAGCPATKKRDEQRCRSLLAVSFAPTRLTASPPALPGTRPDGPPRLQAGRRETWLLPLHQPQRQLMLWQRLRTGTPALDNAVLLRSA